MFKNYRRIRVFFILALCSINLPVMPYLAKQLFRQSLQSLHILFLFRWVRSDDPLHITLIRQAVSNLGLAIGLTGSGHCWKGALGASSPPSHSK